MPRVYKAVGSWVENSQNKFGDAEYTAKNHQKSKFNHTLRTKTRYAMAGFSLASPIAMSFTVWLFFNHVQYLRDASDKTYIVHLRSDRSRTIIFNGSGFVLLSASSLLHPLYEKASRSVVIRAGSKPDILLQPKNGCPERHTIMGVQTHHLEFHGIINSPSPFFCQPLTQLTSISSSVANHQDTVRFIDRKEANPVFPKNWFISGSKRQRLG